MMSGSNSGGSGKVVVNGEIKYGDQKAVNMSISAVKLNILTCGSGGLTCFCSHPQVAIGGTRVFGTSALA